MQPVCTEELRVSGPGAAARRTGRQGVVRLARPETNSFESDIRNTFEAEMNAHLVKPLDADGLYNALKHYIQEAQTEREV